MCPAYQLGVLDVSGISAGSIKCVQNRSWEC